MNIKYIVYISNQFAFFIAFSMSHFHFFNIYYDDIINIHMICTDEIKYKVKYYFAIENLMLH